MSLGNTNKTKIHKIKGTTSADQKITGSIYKICATGGDAIVASASFGWNTSDLDSPAPAAVLETTLKGAGAGLSCIEADFTAVSSSANTLIFYKGNLR